MIGKRLRRLRLARGLTQRELAEPMYTHAYVSTIEAGRRQPSQRALAHFGASVRVDGGVVPSALWRVEGEPATETSSPQM